MPDVSTALYHGIRQNMRRVLVALGPERIEKGLTAFDDGASSWDQCFFARAFQGEARLGMTADRRYVDPSLHICQLLGDPAGNMLVPVKMIWHTFDKAQSFHAGKMMTQAEMKKFITDVMDEGTPVEVLQLIRDTNYSNIEEMTFSCPTT